MAHLDDGLPEGPSPACLVDERSRPNLRTVYGLLARRAARMDVAVRKIRLSGMSLGREELGAPAAIRVVLAEVDVLTLTSEAESLAARGAGRRRLELILQLLELGSLDVRSAPLGNWAPDFSVFSGRTGPRVALVGPHHLDLPYSRGGPRLASVHLGPPAIRLAEHFEDIWSQAHQVRTPLLQTLRDGLARVPEPVDLRYWASGQGPPDGAGRCETRPDQRPSSPRSPPFPAPPPSPDPTDR